MDRELGMDADEILRLSQISGLAEMFKDREFSEAWKTTPGSNVLETNTEEDLEQQAMNNEDLNTENIIEDEKTVENSSLSELEQDNNSNYIPRLL
jgi:hypothetical protein